MSEIQLADLADILRLILISLSAMAIAGLLFSLGFWLGGPIGRMLHRKGIIP